MEKDVIYLVSNLGENKKKSDPLRGIELQTFGFRAPMFLHWATENPLVKARPSQGPHMARVAWFTQLFSVAHGGVLWSLFIYIRARN